MNPPATSSRRLNPAAVLGLLALLAVGLAIRLAGIGKEGLWLDEIYSATYANLTVLQTAVAGMRFDVHPPFYYMQLTAWSRLGHSDVWLLLNSVLWSMATLVGVYLTCARRFGPLAGAIALACCAVMGSEVYFGAELRMYSLFGFLMLMSWVAADRFRADYRFKAGLPLVIALILLGAVHGFGMIAVAAVLLYVFPSGAFGAGVNRARVRAQLPTWIAISFVVCITLLPWLVNATLRKVGHLEPLRLSGVAYTISGWLVGYRDPVLPIWAQTGLTLAVALCLAAATVVVPQLRRTITYFIVVPMALAGVVSAAWKPIWLARSFSFGAPFLAISLGALLARWLQRSESPLYVRITVGSVAAAALAAIGVYSCHEQITPWRTQYREAAGYLREHVQQGDIVYMPEYTTFWAMTRYLVGPEWGDPLRVQDPVNQDRSEIWPRIYQRLGPERLELLHLKPETRRVDGFPVPLFIGWSPLPEVSSARSVWIVGGPELMLNELQLCQHDSAPVAEFRRVLIYRLSCRSGEPALR
jgi:mannosyltransferase